jgi:hypothetical protein
LAHLEAENLRPIGDASRATLIRRASFDLRGLPPSQTEVEAFLRDPSPDDAAFAKVVDTFLQSERFGERWARNWLDVVRYADSVGRVWNAPFLYASRYRYWVIDSFNEDKPYNRFVAEQIDFVRRTFLGLTLACARCHDHKTEPVTLRDYYASAGIFDSSRKLSSTPNRNDGVVGGYVSPEVLVDLPTVALHIGTETFVRPSMDAWIVYGLGSEAEDLVGFVTINPVADNGGAMNYGSAFFARELPTHTPQHHRRRRSRSLEWPTQRRAAAQADRIHPKSQSQAPRGRLGQSRTRRHHSMLRARLQNADQRARRARSR